MLWFGNINISSYLYHVIKKHQNFRAMVVSTIVENGRTIRTWEESRGKKTLTRKFYIKYRVNAICNGKHYTIEMCDTYSETLHVMLNTKKKIDVKFQPKDWLNMSNRTPLTHIVDAGFLATLGAKKSIKLYLTEEGTKETISEVLS